ncbi:MAG TPA: lipopolysaccharide biosynthesis protein [Candidatus Sulfotelmatobacter sp.]|nr:lipopolysaccharide biosynthesis protein [Candidatus Sulfotelmatobacter sp.]
MKSRQILLNALTTVAQELGSAVVLFFLFRFLVHALGIERVGIWSLVLATTSVVTLANQGFATSVVKYIAKNVAAERLGEVALLVETALLSLGGPLIVLSACLYPAAKWILALLLPHPYVAEAVAILPYALLSLFLNLLGSILQAGLDGHQLITHRNYVLLGSSILYLLLAYAAVPRFGILGLAYSQVAQAGACLVATWMLLHRQIPQLPGVPRRWSRAHFRELAAYGLKFQIITGSQAMREPVTKALLAKFGGPAMTGIYDLASRWVVSFRELIVQANQVLVPSVAHLQESDPASLPRVYRDSYRLLLFLAAPTFAFVVAASPIVSWIWLGRYELAFVAFVVLLAAGWLVNVLSNPAYVMDLGMGALRWVSIGCGVTAILNLPLGFLCGKYFGSTAVVAVSAASLALGYALIVVSYHRENRESFRVLFPKETGGVLLSSFAGAALLLPLLHASVSHSRVSLAAVCGISVVLILTVSIFMWVHPLRRRLLGWILARLPA